MTNPIIAVYTRDGYPSANVLKDLPDYAGNKVNTLIISGPNGYQGEIVYNDPPLVMFNSDGVYVGDTAWPDSLTELVSNTNIGSDRIYLSLSNSAISTLAAMSAEGLSGVMAWLKANGIAGIDMDCENWGQPGGLNPMDQAVQTVTMAAIKASLALTAAPYNKQSAWQQWCDFVNSNNGVLSWLNVQCYAGGTGNNPVQWANAFKPVPVVAGFEAISSTSQDGGQLSPYNALKQLAEWQLKAPGKTLSGAFVWEFTMIVSQQNTYKYTVKEYADSMFIGLNS